MMVAKALVGAKTFLRHVVLTLCQNIFYTELAEISQMCQL